MDDFLNAISTDPMRSYFGIIGLVVVVAVAAGVLSLIVWAVRAIHQAILRSKVSKEYSVSVPSSVKVKKARQRSRIGAFRMGYPMWEAAKKDGTRDRRTNNSRIIKNPTVILIGRWELNGKDPFEAYALVTAFRQAGHAIGYCHEEQYKRQQLMGKVQARRQATSIDGIIAQFKDSPTDFEPFCADLFRKLGWWAETTPPVRDGGFDLKLRRPDGVTYIAECKCYDRRHHAGRPIIQKLQGANMVERAQGMMLITTSSFSQDAVDYARQVGVELIDGAELVRRCHQAWGNSATNVTIPETSVWLTDNEIMSFIPVDMRSRYY